MLVHGCPIVLDTFTLLARDVARFLLFFAAVYLQVLVPLLILLLCIHADFCQIR